MGGRSREELGRGGDWSGEAGTGQKHMRPLERAERKELLVYFSSYSNMLQLMFM